MRYMNSRCVLHVSYRKDGEERMTFLGLESIEIEFAGRCLCVRVCMTEIETEF